MVVGGWWLVLVVQFWEFNAEFSVQSSQKLTVLLEGGGVGGPPPSLDMGSSVDVHAAVQLFFVVGLVLPSPLMKPLRR